MALQYSLYGGATRPTAISGLNPKFAAALEQLYAAAPPQVRAELGLNSAYRTREEQQALWDKSDKTGRMVAAPGKSKHESGAAADLRGFGLKGGGNVSDATKQWVKQNAEQFGLYFPMDYEPWHVQLRGGDVGPQQGPPASAQIGPEQYRQAFLDSIARGESPGYDVMYGGAKFTDFSRHPHANQTAGGVTSDAAGRYQFRGSTWDEQQKKYGYKDFSQQSQDLAAWNYANDIFKAKTGGDLQAALSSNDPGQINAAASVLNQTWSSLPGGKEQSKGYGDKTFYDIYSGHLGSGGTGTGTPVASTGGAATPQQGAAPAPDNQFALPKTKEEPPKNWLQVFGDSMQDAATAPLPKVQTASQQPAGPAITADQPAAPFAALGAQDPARRQQLAQLLAQLNAGKLTL